MSVDFSVKTFIPQDIKHLSDEAIQDAFVRALYAFRRAEPGTPEIAP